MLPTLKTRIVALFLCGIFLLHFSTPFVIAGDYKALYQDLRNDSKGYATKGNLEDMENIAPQYDQVQTGNLEDSSYSEKFYNYGHELTNSCTIITTKETRELICEERTEYIFENIPVLQKRILDEIIWDLESYWIEKTVHYCELNNTTYDNLAQCTTDCQDSQNTDIVYNCPSGSYNHITGVCETSPACPDGGSYNTATNRCEIIMSPNCPVGYTEQGNQCVRTTSYQASEYSICTGMFERFGKFPAKRSCSAVPGGTCTSGTGINSSSFNFDQNCGIKLEYPNRTLMPGDSYVDYDYNGEHVSTVSNLSEKHLSCPNGGVLNGTICTITETIPKSPPVCPTGYTYNSSINKCQANPVCATGTYNSAAKKCVVNATAGNCPVGYTPQGNQCIKITTQPVSVEACVLTGLSGDEYYSYNDIYEEYVVSFGESFTINVNWGINCASNRPSQKITIPSSCVGGWWLYDSAGTCWADWGLKPYYSCPSGYTLNGEQCLKTETTPLPSNSCPSGFTYDSALGMCVVTPTCNSGGTFNSLTNKCELSLTSSCPSGFTISSSLCYKAAYCIPGTTLNGTSDKCTVQATTNYTCPTGYVKINNDTCLKTVACSNTPILEEHTKEEASLIYILQPESFLPLINCSFGTYSCVDSRNTCVSKSSSGDCLRNENICWEYNRNGSCQKKITNTYTECGYHITAEQIN